MPTCRYTETEGGACPGLLARGQLFTGCACAGSVRRQSWLWEISELGREGIGLVDFLSGRQACVL